MPISTDAQSKLVPVLNRHNAHPRDQYLVFDEPTHKYTILLDPHSQYTSATTFVHSHFPHFDQDDVIAKILRNPKHKSPDSKYFNMTAENIRESWRQNAAQASELGTQLHFEIECFYNADLVECTEDAEEYGAQQAQQEVTLFPYNHTHLLAAYDPTDVDPLVCESPEWSFFLQFVRDFPHMEPYRTEWMIFDEDLKIAGSIDMVFRDSRTGTLAIYDWKRAKEIKTVSFNHACATSPLLKNIPDSNFWHYSLQLNLYKAILHRKYNVVVDDLYLIRLHDNNPNKTYDRIACYNLQPQVELLFEDLLLKHRMKMAAPLTVVNGEVNLF